MADSNTIRILLTLDGKQYVADLSAAEARTKTFAGTAANTGTQISLLGAAVAGVAGGFATQLPQAVLQAAMAISKAGDEVQRLRDRLEATSATSTQGAAMFDYIVRQSDRLGVALRANADNWTGLSSATRGTSLEGQATRDIFEALTEAGARLNLENREMSQTFDAVERIVLRGNATLGDFTGAVGRNIPQALDATARALGITTDRLRELLREGDVTANELVPALAQGLRDAFNTDSQTRIEGHGQSIARLRNEIGLLAAEIGEKLNVSLAGTSEAAANALKYIREQGFEALGALAKGGLLGLYFNSSAYASEQAAIAQQNRDVDRIFGASPAGAVFDTNRLLGPVARFAANDPRAAGSPLLTSGGGRADPELAAQLQRQLDLLSKQSEVEKTMYEISSGKLRNADNETKNKALALAYAKDQAKADKEAASAAERAAADQQRAHERDLQQALAAEQAERNKLQQLEGQRLLLDYQLETGTKLTGAAAELYVLQNQSRMVLTRTLDDELAIVAAKQNQVALQEQLRQELDRSLERVERQLAPQSATSGLNFDLQGARSFGDVTTAEDEATRREQARYEQQLAVLDQAHDTQRISTERYYELMEAAEQKHQDTLVRIQRSGADARVDLTRSTLQGISGITANLERAAQYAGLERSKRGFEINKKIQVLQAQANTAMAISNALAVSPYWVGVALAVSAGIAGAAQQAAIEQQEWPGAASGYERGGWARAGGMYQVAEKGKPELYEEDGNFYLLAGSGGRVTPASKAANGPGGIQVQLNVYGASGGTVDATASIDGNNAVIDLAIKGSVEALRKDIAGNGTTARLMQRTWSLKRTGT